MSCASKTCKKLCRIFGETALRRAACVPIVSLPIPPGRVKRPKSSPRLACNSESLLPHGELRHDIGPFSTPFSPTSRSLAEFNLPLFKVSSYVRQLIAMHSQVFGGLTYAPDLHGLATPTGVCGTGLCPSLAQHSLPEVNGPMNTGRKTLRSLRVGKLSKVF
ncbi:uncharacterized protein FOMMEDRAFT_157193 [Fomitiporia mediterranea MF3/22]|uniref:uncharacterized protein n=1 Tax=Fomitiporia mediterranea (strain MF3/22) TaxID=694068 RepID=UPI00044077B3|nr:uncharacterized protein FOMMEDRAFT_157193 [Fomitiporia mediterranea MF3/22]EJD02018.1 hypothetical protein FOMMEDRAFT_157193 [Fomitiporia mediterranea MF3/22]